MSLIITSLSVLASLLVFSSSVDGCNKARMSGDHPKLMLPHPTLVQDTSKQIMTEEDILEEIFKEDPLEKFFEEIFVPSTTTSTTTTTTTEMPEAVVEIEDVTKTGDGVVLTWSNGVIMTIRLTHVEECLFEGKMPWDETSRVELEGCSKDDFSLDVKSEVYGDRMILVKNGDTGDVTDIVDKIFNI